MTGSGSISIDSAAHYNQKYRKQRITLNYLIAVIGDNRDLAAGLAFNSAGEIGSHCDIVNTKGFALYFRTRPIAAIPFKPTLSIHFEKADVALSKRLICLHT